MMRVQRKEDFENDLENAEYEKKTALMWGYGTENSEQTIRQIKKGYGSWRRRFWFAAFNWPLMILGGLALLFAWLNHEPATGPKGAPFFIFLIFVIAYVGYHYHRHTQKLERRLRWIEETLVAAVNRKSERKRWVSD